MKIVLTGAACSGKTTLVNAIADHGLDIKILPESATEVLNSGILPWEDAIKFNTEVLF